MSTLSMANRPTNGLVPQTTLTWQDVRTQVQHEELARHVPTATMAESVIQNLLSKPNDNGSHNIGYEDVLSEH
jgi:hypothetical protein